MTLVSFPLASFLLRRRLNKPSEQLLSLASNVFVVNDECQLADDSLLSASVMLCSLLKSTDFLQQLLLLSAVLCILPFLFSLHSLAELSIRLRLHLCILSLLKKIKVLLLECFNLAQELLFPRLLFLDFGRLTELFYASIIRGLHLLADGI